MKIFTLSIALFIQIILPNSLSADVLSDFKEFTTQMNNAATKQQEEFELYKKELEDGFAAYKKAYQEEFEKYKQQVMQQWGEFTPGNKTLWVSYVENGETRRLVNFENGEVEVDLLIDDNLGIDDVNQRLNKQIYNLLNTTEAEAFKTDSVAQNVEKQLTTATPLVIQGSPTNRRLFTLDDLTALILNPSEFLKVSNKTKNTVKKDLIKAKVAGKNIVRAKFNIPDTILEKAMRFNEAVNRAAQKEQLSPALIFAIMETESSFNPMAKSHIPAYGLMQIVPHSAGKDATAYLFGEARILAPSYLYSSDNNINIGSAYLHVLYYKYMAKVKDPASRLYCAIAAYNTGPSNVAKAFIKVRNFTAASKKINLLSADEVYVRLKKYLPYKETRHYVERVTNRMKNYL